MNLERALRMEHSKAKCDKIVKYIGDDKARFAELMNLFFGGEYRITQRTAWPMNYCVRHHTSFVKPYFKKLLDKLEMKTGHPAAKRNIVRLFQFVEIPKR